MPFSPEMNTFYTFFCVFFFEAGLAQSPPCIRLTQTNYLRTRPPPNGVKCLKAERFPNDVFSATENSFFLCRWTNQRLLWQRFQNADFLSQNHFFSYMMIINMINISVLSRYQRILKTATASSSSRQHIFVAGQVEGTLWKTPCLYGPFYLFKYQKNIPRPPPS